MTEYELTDHPVFGVTPDTTEQIADQQSMSLAQSSDELDDQLTRSRVPEHYFKLCSSTNYNSLMFSEHSE